MFDTSKLKRKHENERKEMRILTLTFSNIFVCARRRQRKTLFLALCFVYQRKPQSRDNLKTVKRTRIDPEAEAINTWTAKRCRRNAKTLMKSKSKDVTAMIWMMIRIKGYFFFRSFKKSSKLVSRRFFFTQLLESQEVL